MKVNVRVPFRSFDGSMVSAGAHDLCERAIEAGNRCGAISDEPVREPKKKPKRTPKNKSIEDLETK